MSSPVEAQTQVVDAVFARKNGRGRPSGKSNGAVRLDQTPPPGAFCEQADLKAEHEWVQEERKRLEEYTVNQFALLKQMREEMLAHRCKSDETLLLRQRELDRQAKLQAGRAEALKKREALVAEREAAVTRQAAEGEVSLAVHLARLARSQEDLKALEQANEKLQNETIGQRLTLEQVRQETAQAQQGLRAAKGELEGIEQVLAQKKRAVEEQQAELAARQGRLEERYVALERAEKALERRRAEVEELEEAVRSELEEGECRLAQAYRELETLQARLRLLTLAPEAPAPQEELAPEAEQALAAALADMARP